jgi:hypothetical protein
MPWSVSQGDWPRADPAWIKLIATELPGGWLLPAESILFILCPLRTYLQYRDGIDDLAPRLSAIVGVSRAAHAPLRPLVVHQLFFQYSSRLNEQLR